MADEYSDKDLYGDYSYEDADTPASLFALVAAFRNLTVNSAMIEALAVQNAHIQSVAANKIEAGEITVDSNNLAFNAQWKTDTLGWDLASGVTRNTAIKPWGYPTIESKQIGHTSPVWRGAKTNSEYRIPCVPGETFTGSVYWRVFDPTTFDANSGLLIELHWHDASGSRISTSAPALVSDVSGRGSFERLSVTGTAPANTVSVGINFWVRQNGTAYFGRPQLQRGKFLTEFTDNGTYIGPNGIMTTDLKFSGTLEGANGTFTGKLTSDGPDYDIVIDGGYVRSYSGTTIMNQIGMGGFKVNPGNVNSNAYFDLAGLGGRHGGVIWSLTHNGEGAADAFEIYTNKNALLKSTSTKIVSTDPQVLKLYGTSYAYMAYYVDDVRRGYMGLASSAHNDMGMVAENGNIQLLASSNIIKLPSSTFMDMTGNVARLHRTSNDYWAQSSTSAVIYFGGVARHTFSSSGTKSGGSIVIDGENLGMSPIDSPQILIEYIEFDIPLSPAGTKVYLDAQYRKAVENFALFPNNGKITEKGSDYFVITGEGVADIRIVGERTGYSEVFWADMDSLTEHREETVHGNILEETPA